MILNLPVRTGGDTGTTQPTHPRGGRPPVNVRSRSETSLPHLSDQPKQDCPRNLSVRENYDLQLFAKIRRKRPHFTGNAVSHRPTLVMLDGTVLMCRCFIASPANWQAAVSLTSSRQHHRLQTLPSAPMSLRPDTPCRWLRHRCPVTIRIGSRCPR